MKLARVLLLIFSLSLPVTGIAYPSYYSSKPKVSKVTYCTSKHCHCSYCDPYAYGYYCTYCYDSHYGCPECDREAGKIIIIGTIIAAAAYLINRVINS